MTSPALPFDSNRAWQQAVGAIRANREVLFALAGVFFLLPSLAFALLFPEPPLPAGASQDAVMARAMNFYTSTLPVAIPMFVLQAGGILSLLTLLTDRARPTVREAIRMGFASVLPYLGAQIVLGFVLGMVAMPVLILTQLAGAPAIAGLGVVIVIMLWIYAAVRTSLSAPVIAVEGVRNPLHALRRSWQLTRGHTLRLLVFFALIILSFAVFYSVVSLVSGVVLALVLPAKLTLVVAAIISAVLGAGMALTLVAALAAIHAQLARPEDAISAAFE